MVWTKFATGLHTYSHPNLLIRFGMGLHLVQLVCHWFALWFALVCHWFELGSACQWPLRMVSGPAHGARVDVIKLAATPWAPVLVALSIFEELLFAVPHSRRDGSVVSSRDERQPAQNRRNRHNVDLWIRLRLIQQLSSDLACLVPPRGDSPVEQG